MKWLPVKFVGRFRLAGDGECVGASRTGTLCFFSVEDAGRDTVSSDREKRHGAEASDAADRNSFPARKVSKRSELLLIFP